MCLCVYMYVCGCMDKKIEMKQHNARLNPSEMCLFLLLGRSQKKVFQNLGLILTLQPNMVSSKLFVYAGCSGVIHYQVNRRPFFFFSCECVMWLFAFR